MSSGAIGRRLGSTLDVLPPRIADRISLFGQRAPLPDPVESSPSPSPPADVDVSERTGPTFARSRIRRANILMYHRIASDPADPYSLCVSAERFTKQLEVLVSLAEVVSLDELRQPRQRPMIAVTFDDGYADNVLAALPIAERFDVSFTVFVTSRMVGRPNGFWWDRLAHALLRPERREISVRLPDRTVSIATGTDAGALAGLAQLRQRLLLLPVEQIDDVLDRLWADAASEPEAAFPRPLSVDELHTLAMHPLVTIGAHTTDHTMLAAQPPAAQLESIASSKSDLETMLGAEVRHFAYPFGHRASFNRRSIDAVRRCGFATASSTLAGCVTRWSDPLCLPRRMVLDWEGEVFGAMLRSWGLR